MEISYTWTLTFQWNVYSIKCHRVRNLYICASYISFYISYLWHILGILICYTHVYVNVWCIRVFFLDLYKRMLYMYMDRYIYVHDSIICACYGISWFCCGCCSLSCLTLFRFYRLCNSLQKRYHLINSAEPKNCPKIPVSLVLQDITLLCL